VVHTNVTEEHRRPSTVIGARRVRPVEEQTSAPEPSARAPINRPGRGRPRRTTPHPTATLLLDTAVELLETVPVDGLTIALVLEHSGVSYGSLYHHYADISDLVEQAIVHRYTRRLKESLRAVHTLLESTDATDFRQRVEALLDQSMHPGRRQNRLERVEALGALNGRPRLVERIARAQQEITDEQAGVIIELQQRGWVRTDLDPVALSAFIQAVTLGRVVDDVAEHPVLREGWNDVALRAFRAVLFPD
jgi:AcrR family transcriptional regulator